MQNSLFSEGNSAKILPGRDRAVQTWTIRGQSRDTGDLGQLQQGRLEGNEKRAGSDGSSQYFFPLNFIIIY